MVAICVVILAAALAPPPVLRINGSTTISPIVSDAAELISKEIKLTIQVDVQGGSSGGITALAKGKVDIAMSTRPITEDDVRKYPKSKFMSYTIGWDAVSVVISRDVWNSGVRSLTRDQIRGAYEGKIRSWVELGGPRCRIMFFNREPGRGTWEAFAKWLYGNSSSAPLVSHPEVGGNEEARSKLKSTPCAATLLSSAWSDNVELFTVGLRQRDGSVTRPTKTTISQGIYPIVRPLLLITDGPPDENEQRFISFMQSVRGQEIVSQHGHVPFGRRTR